MKTLRQQQESSSRTSHKSIVGAYEDRMIRFHSLYDVSARGPPSCEFEAKLHGGRVLGGPRHLPMTQTAMGNNGAWMLIKIRLFSLQSSGDCHPLSSSVRLRSMIHLYCNKRPISVTESIDS